MKDAKLFTWKGFFSKIRKVFGIKSLLFNSHANGFTNLVTFSVMLYQLSVYCASDIGLIRQNNEDSWKLLEDEQFFVLADGMGGHQAGEVASRETVEQLCLLFQQYRHLFQQDITSAKQALKEMIREVNASVYYLGREDAHLRGMGTTLCCLFFHPNGLIYGHVGDSRIYRFRQGKLEQLTRDHSLLQELIDLGQLSQQQAEEFLYKNIITKAIGTEQNVEPEIHETSLEVGDVLMMCTDGLSDVVCFETLQEIMTQNSEEDVVNLLIENAKQNGGYDNITVVLVKILGKHASHLS